MCVQPYSVTLKLHQKSRLSTFDTWVYSGGGGGLHE